MFSSKMPVNNTFRRSKCLASKTATLIISKAKGEAYHWHRECTGGVSLQNVGTVDHEVVFESCW